jgi:hypothetical protein
MTPGVFAPGRLDVPVDVPIDVPALVPADVPPEPPVDPLEPPDDCASAEFAPSANAAVRRSAILRIGAMIHPFVVFGCSVDRGKTRGDKVAFRPNAANSGGQRRKWASNRTGVPLRNRPTAIVHP